VETYYGGNTGHHRVIDALSTLAFSYPKRSKFFTSELENFLILCREEKMNPLDPTGSYAGAMGIPQFMPSSYRSYAADFEDDGKRDIWNNPADAIASVANYFIKHHWHKDEFIAFPVKAFGKAHQKALLKGLKPQMTWFNLQAMGVNAMQLIKPDEKVKLLAYQQQKGDDLWIGLHNFYVITRYNHSPLYGMAVYQLSQAIYKQRHQQASISQ
jgi:membrane-bound lytic murein transglycosylase B